MGFIFLENFRIVEKQPGGRTALHRFEVRLKFFYVKLEGLAGGKSLNLEYVLLFQSITIAIAAIEVLFTALACVTD